jgi:PAS domain S-box-containing protein
MGPQFHSDLLRLVRRYYPWAMPVLFSFVAMSYWCMNVIYHHHRIENALMMWTQLECQVVSQTAQVSRAWLDLNIRAGIAPDIAEQEVLIRFVQTIRLSKNGDAWIYNRRHPVFDNSSDFPEEYRQKNIRDIFEIQKQKGASHYQALCDGVMNATDGADWYVWLPEKGREYAAWTSFQVADDTWTIGVSTPESEILDYFQIRKEYFRELVAILIITGLITMICVLTWRLQHSDRHQRESLEQAVADRTEQLSAMNRELNETQQSLRKNRDELELKVKERTHDLQIAIEKLVEEIKARQLIESELLESREKYQNLFQNALVGLFRTRISDGKVLECNHQVSHILGYDDMDEFMHQFVAQNYYVDSQKRIEFITLLNNFSCIQNFEAQFYRKDGSIRWLSYSAQIFPEHGYLEGVLIDIDDRKQAEMQLQKSKATLRAVLDGISDPILMVNKDMLFQIINQAALKYFQIPPDIDVIGLPCHELAPCKAYCTTCLIRKAKDNMTERVLERCSPLYPGKKEVLSFDSFRYPDNSAQCGMIVRITDVTEKRRIQEQLVRANRMTGLATLSAGIAHEIRNPLSSISLFTDLLLDSDRFDMVPQAREILGDIKENALKISLIIKQVLDLARGSGEKKQLYDLNAILADILEFWIQRIKINRIQLEFYPVSGLPNVYVEPMQIMHVLNNLILNAIESMEEGGGLCVSTSLAKSSLISGREVVAIHISDTGSGIFPEDMDKIFDPFFTTKMTGAGLGLSISYKIIKDHGGIISVESDPGNGAIFTVELPVCQGNCSCKNPDIPH